MTSGHIFGAGACWCGYSIESYREGGPNHIVVAAEPIDEETGKCRYCNGRWDPVRDWREYAHEPTCPWLLGGQTP